MSPSSSSSTPREIYTLACQIISDALEGFTFQRSRKRAVRKIDGWRDIVQFETSVHNKAGYVYVDVWLESWNDQLALWRKEHYPAISARGGKVFRSTLSRLGPPSPPPWNVAPPYTEAGVTEIVHAIEQTGFPFLEQARHRSTMVDAAFRAGETTTFVHFLLSQGDVQLLVEFLTRLHDSHREYFEVWRQEAIDDDTAPHKTGRMIADAGLQWVFSGIPTSGDEPTSISPMRRRLTYLSREELSDEVRRWGEDQVAANVLTISEEQLQQQQERAFVYAMEQDITLSKAAAMAAVEVVEGTRRPLARERRSVL